MLDGSGGKTKTFWTSRKKKIAAIVALVSGFTSGREVGIRWEEKNEDELIMEMLTDKEACKNIENTFFLGLMIQLQQCISSSLALNSEMQAAMVQKGPGVRKRVMEELQERYTELQTKAGVVQYDPARADFELISQLATDSSSAAGAQD